MQPQVNHNSKSQLAKLLAVENITVRHQASASTASFDVKNRVLTLPVWKEMSVDLYDMLVIHEVGHALDTPAEGWMNALKDIAKRIGGSDSLKACSSVKGFLNVVEDARIDKRQKRRFPGSKRNYVIGYKDLFDRDFFGLKNREVNSMTFIDRMNIYFKGGYAMNIQFNAEERKFIKRAEDAETWAEVLQLTEEIYAYAKSKKEDENNQKDDLIYSDEEEEGEDGDGYSFDEDDAEDSEDESQEPKRGSKADEDDDGEVDDDIDAEDGIDDGDDGEETEDETETDKTSGGKDGDAEAELPESETDKAFEARKEELVAGNSGDIHYVKVSRIDHTKVVDDYKIVIAQWEKELANYYGLERKSQILERFNKFKSDENNSISFMVKEFESKKAADIYSRVSVAKTGVIDTNKLTSYKYSDDIFRRLSVIPQGKNHGFVMFLDWSGSMDSYMKNTLKQLFSMVLFCKRVQIPFEVYAFRSCAHNDHLPSTDVWKDYHEPSTMAMNSFKLRNILSSRMKGIELNFAMAMLLETGRRMNSDPLMSTPLNQAIIAAEKIINDFRSKNKVQVVNTVFLTDGQSDGIHDFNIAGTSRSTYSYENYTKKINHPDRYILQDEVTKKEYNLEGRDNGQTHTKVLLRRLKDRTGCNMVGFFLTGGGFNRIAQENNMYGNTEYLDKQKKFFSDNNFLAVTSAGYDKYFVINSSKMNSETAPLIISSDMSKAKIATAFMKFSEKKTVNRVLLRQFIELVCA